MKGDELYRLRIALRRSRRDTSEKLAIALQKLSDKDSTIWEMQLSQLRTLDTQEILRQENAQLASSLERAREIIAGYGVAELHLPLRPLSPILDSNPHEMIRRSSPYGDDWLQEDYYTRNTGPMPTDIGSPYAQTNGFESASEPSYGGATPNSFLSDF